MEGFHFWEKPILLPDTCPEETNVYDMRLTQHEDGWIYGVFCSESKDNSETDLSAAVAAAGIVRTKDLKTWERLPNLVTKRSPQQRNVDLLPEFVNGKYAFYTRPMDGFIDTGSGSGIGFGLCEDITHPVIDEEKMTSIPPLPHHHRGQERRGLRADQDRPRMDPHRARRPQLRFRTALCAVFVCDRPEGSFQGHRGALRRVPRPAPGGARRRRVQRCLRQRRLRGG